jgi:hypothetical protein
MCKSENAAVVCIICIVVRMKEEQHSGSRHQYYEWGVNAKQIDFVASWLEHALCGTRQQRVGCEK